VASTVASCACASDVPSVATLRRASAAAVVTGRRESETMASSGARTSAPIATSCRPASRASSSAGSEVTATWARPDSSAASESPAGAGAIVTASAPLRNAPSACAS